MSSKFDNIIDRRIINEDELKEANISAEDMKKIIKDTIGRISETLTRKDFIRWMKDRDISKKIRKLVIKIYDGENDILLTEKTNVGGYYTVGQQKIVTRDKDDEGVQTHEVTHFITDRTTEGMSKKEVMATRFNRFLNEGITEYISTMVDADKASGKGYLQNLIIAEQLHKTLGDVLIKSYLLGKPEIIKNEIERLAPNKGIFERLNCEEFPQSKEEIEQLAEDLRTLQMAKFKEKTQSLELYGKFYSNGEFDAKSFDSYIQGLSRDVYNMKLKLGLNCDISEFSNFNNMAYIEFFKYSHLFEENDIQAEKNGRQVLERNAQINPNDLVNKLLKLQLGKKDDITMLEYIDALSQVQYNIIKGKNMDVSHIFALSRIYSNHQKSEMFYNKAQSIYPMCDALNKLQNKNKENTVESIFYELPTEEEGTKTYIERRDRNFYYVKINSKTGEIDEKEINYGIYDHDNNFLQISPVMMGISKKTQEISDEQKKSLNGKTNQKNIYTDSLMIKTGRDHQETHLMFVEDEPEIAVTSEGKTQIVRGKSLQDLKEDAIKQSILEKIRKKADKGKYVKNDGIQSLNYEMLIEDLAEAREFLPYLNDILSPDDFEKEAKEILIGLTIKTYGLTSPSQKEKFSIFGLANKIIEYSQSIDEFNEDEREEQIKDRKATEEGKIESSDLLNSLKNLENLRMNRLKEQTEEFLKSGISLIQSAVEATENIRVGTMVEQRNNIAERETKKQQGLQEEKDTDGPNYN